METQCSSDDLFIALGANRFNGLLDFRQSRHAGRNDHRPLFAGHILQQGQMHDVHRGNLEKWHVQLFQEVNLFHRERGRAEGNAPGLAMGMGFKMLLGG